MLNRRRWLWSIALGAGALPTLAQSPENILRREAVYRERLRMDRFTHQAQAGPFRVGAMFTGRTVLAAARSVFVRNHLVVELLVEPPHPDGIPLNSAWLQLRVNAEKQPRLPQTPELVAYYIRTEQDALGPRLQASAGVGNGGVLLDTGGQRRARFPGDPRTPRTPRPPSQERHAANSASDPLEADAEFVTTQAFRGGPIQEPTTGYLYYPCDLDLAKIRTLELLVFAEGESRSPTVLRLK